MGKLCSNVLESTEKYLLLFREVAMFFSQFSNNFRLFSSNFWLFLILLEEKLLLFWRVGWLNSNNTILHRILKQFESSKFHSNSVICIYGTPRFFNKNLKGKRIASNPFFENYDENFFLNFAQKNTSFLKKWLKYCKIWFFFFLYFEIFWFDKCPVIQFFNTFSKL